MSGWQGIFICVFVRIDGRCLCGGSCVGEHMCGWPMNVWLTPERLPYYGGTYFPARDGDRGSGRGFLTLLKILKDAFHNQKDKIHKTSTGLAQAVKNNLKPVPGTGIPSKEIMTKVVNYFKNNSDKIDGGIGRRNKFPSSVPSRFLLRSHRKSKDPEVLKIVNLNMVESSSTFKHQDSISMLLILFNINLLTSSKGVVLSLFISITT